MTQALVNARVLTPEGWRDDCAVLLDGTRIDGVVAPSDPRVARAQRHDLGGALLAPGFIDIQVNGGGGVLFNDTPTADGIARIGAAHRRYGTTGFLPTLISDTPEQVVAALAAVDRALAQGIPGVLGVHLEGPFLAPRRKGVHDAAFFHAPTGAELARLTAPHAGVRVLTLAPDCVPEADVRTLAAHGNLVCIGHTAADYATVRAALAAGARGFTHLFNAMTPFGSREPGVVGAALEDAESWCGIIVDGHHVHPASLRVALAAKARGKLVLVTDAMPPVGADEPTFVLHGEPIAIRDGVCQTDTGVLAGSALDMATAVRNTITLLGAAPEEALRMASAYPADFLGLGATHGRIAAGYAADLVALDSDYRVRGTWITGNYAAASAAPGP